MSNQTDHVTYFLDLIEEWRSLQDMTLTLDGRSLTISKLVAIAERRVYEVGLTPEVENQLGKNAVYLQDKIASGHVIYGVNTGYGGSANVRCADLQEMQRTLIKHLNVSFGQTVDPGIVRGVMAVRANSLALAYSGVRPEIVRLLCAMINADVVPVVPLRGSISASGDLVPTSYIAACMSGRPDAKVIYAGKETLATEAFEEARLSFVEFQAKEALAVINASSFASTLAAKVLFDAGIALLLTQVVTAMSMECLHGRMESFHPTVHLGLPHQGNQEVARNICRLLKGSQLVKHGLESSKEDDPETLKQDRYPLRTSAQWIGPTTEILMASIRRVTVELNSVNDNPIIDHRQDEIIHGGNFQGISITIAMDQTRQALQLCGKLVFAQLSEILNYTMSDGLPPNLSGCDVRSDFGFKGVDIATASYASELDYLTNPMTNHVLSAEMHNQSVNSMALVSSRMTDKALELLQMMLTNALCAQCQAIDLRWLQIQVNNAWKSLIKRCQLVDRLADMELPLPWYQVAFCTSKRCEILEAVLLSGGIQSNGIMSGFYSDVDRLRELVITGKHADEVVACLGEGTREVYSFVRKALKIQFNHGSEADPIDRSLEKIFSSIQSRQIVDLVCRVFRKDPNFSQITAFMKNGTA